MVNQANLKPQYAQLYRLAAVVEGITQLDFFRQPSTVTAGATLPVGNMPVTATYESMSTILKRPTLKYTITPFTVAPGDWDSWSIWVQDVNWDYPEACRAALAAGIREIATKDGQISMKQISTAAYM